MHYPQPPLVKAVTENKIHTAALNPIMFLPYEPEMCLAIPVTSVLAGKHTARKEITNHLESCMTNRISPREAEKKK